MVEQQEFFTAWSCDTLEDYLLDKNVPDEYPSHNDITDEQHIRLHTIYQECVDNTSFLSPHA